MSNTSNLKPVIPASSGRIRPGAQIQLKPPTLVPISEADWRDAVSALAEMLVPALDSLAHDACGDGHPNGSNPVRGRDEATMTPLDDPLEASAAAKQMSALLREARSLQRCASKLVGAASHADLSTNAVFADMETAIQRAVAHLARLERTQQRRANDALRRRR